MAGRCPGHPRLGGKEDVDGRNKSGHDELWQSLLCGAFYLSRRVELLQFLSDDHTVRVSLKQSTGVEEPSASKRCSSTPLHCKPHFSRMLREDGLVTRAPDSKCSTSNSSKVKSITARAASVPKPWLQCSTPSQ